MKLTLSLAALIVAAPLLSAQIVVTNPISDALSQVQHVENIAKQIQQITNQVQQINTLNQQLQQVQAYVKAFGDPSQITHIAGANPLIGSLHLNGVGQTMAQLQQLTNGPAALSYNGNGLFQSLGTSFSTPTGVQVPREQDLYLKYGAIQQGSQNFQSVTTDVLARRATLRQQIASTTQQLQVATTDAETQKLNGVLAGYNAELATVDKEIDHAAAQVTTQDIENRADRERQEDALREERQAQIQQGVTQFGQVFQLDASAPAFPTSR